MVIFKLFQLNYDSYKQMPVKKFIEMQMKLQQEHKKICPHCNEGNLEIVSADEPWTIEHLQCSHCDSTYSL